VDKRVCSGEVCVDRLQGSDEIRRGVGSARSEWIYVCRGMEKEEIRYADCRRDNIIEERIC